jgi:hypothetical protein
LQSANSMASSVLPLNLLLLTVIFEHLTELQPIDPPEKVLLLMVLFNMLRTSKHSASILAGCAGIFKVLPLMVQLEVVMFDMAVLPLMATADSSILAAGTMLRSTTLLLNVPPDVIAVSASKKKPRYPVFVIVQLVTEVLLYGPANIPNDANDDTLTCDTEQLLACICMPTTPFGSPEVLLLQVPVKLPLEILAPGADNVIAVAHWLVLVMLIEAPFRLSECGTESPVI